MSDRVARRNRILELFQALESDSITKEDRERLNVELDSLMGSGNDAVVFVLVTSVAVALAFGCFARWLVS